MPWTAADIPDQSGRLALITGASSGLGLETARALVRRGATVVLGCRSRQRSEQARTSLLADAAGGAIDLLDLDLADLASVRAAARELADRYGRLDLLINNAGVMGLPRSLTSDGFEMQFGVNHLGHYALTMALLPLLRARPASRVVTVTSGAQYFGRIAFDDLQGERRYDRWAAYGQSKLANVMFALELQQQLLAAGADVLSLAAHPGIARTNLQPSYRKHQNVQSQSKFSLSSRNRVCCCQWAEECCASGAGSQCCASQEPRGRLRVADSRETAGDAVSDPRIWRLVLPGWRLRCL